MDQKVNLKALLSATHGVPEADPRPKRAIKFNESPISILNALEKMGFTVISTNVREITDDGTIDELGRTTHYSWTLYKEMEFD